MSPSCAAGLLLSELSRNRREYEYERDIPLAALLLTSALAASQTLHGKTFVTTDADLILYCT